MILSLPILPIVLWAAVTLQSGFSSPDFVTPYGSGAFQNVVVWYVGQSKEVAYSIADLSGLDNYTIALWQQATDGGAATLGPVVNSISPPEVGGSFSWTVQLYDFDLDASNVFFFWLFEGGADDQGNTAFKDFFHCVISHNVHNDELDKWFDFSFNFSSNLGVYRGRHNYDDPGWGCVRGNGVDLNPNNGWQWHEIIRFKVARTKRHLDWGGHRNRGEEGSVITGTGWTQWISTNCLPTAQ